MKSPELVVVIGAGPGVGAAVAGAFARKGHPILLVSRSAANLEKLAEGIRRTGVEVSTAEADAAIPGDIARVIEQISTPIDALVYNSAAFGGPLLSSSSEQIRSATEVNLYSLISATKAALPSLKKTSGAVLVTGGGFALYPSSNYGILSVGKAMVRSAALLLAQELAPEGVRVVTITICGTVAPGTPFDPDLIAQSYIAAFEGSSGEVETVFTGEVV